MTSDRYHRWWFRPRHLGTAAVMVVGLAQSDGSRADEPDGKPTAAAATPAGPQPAPAYWQAPPLPQAVIQGGTIPPGWQPQAVPYQGVGPDGQPLTMYFAPTYVFTYQSGPPVPAIPQVNRRGWWGGQPSPTMAAPAAGGWNYATSGAPPVATSLPPGGVTQYRSAYRFPADARALQGTELVPPGPLPPRPDGEAEAWSGPSAASPPVQPPPTQWMPAEAQAAAVPQLPLAAAPVAAVASAQSAAQPPPASSPIQPLTPPPATPTSTRLWRVVGVYDGDTVTCLDENGQQQKVHLAGIDAPEGSAPQGLASREALAGMVFGRVVEVADQGRDGSGTWIARLAVDGSDVGRQMVATGNAACDATAADPVLTAAQATAQAQQLGIWAQAAGQQP